MTNLLIFNNVIMRTLR